MCFSNNSLSQIRLTVFIFLLENTFTRVPKRLYVFKGSELAISPNLVIKYMDSRLNGPADHQISYLNSSSSSESSIDDNEEQEEAEYDGDNFIATVIQTCREDPILEADRKRRLEMEDDDVVEVIYCDEEPPCPETRVSGDGGPVEENLQAPSNSVSLEVGSEFSSHQPPEPKRRKVDTEGQVEKEGLVGSSSSNENLSNGTVP